MIKTDFSVDLENSIAGEWFNICLNEIDKFRIEIADCKLEMNGSYYI